MKFVVLKSNPNFKHDEGNPVRLMFHEWFGLIRIFSFFIQNLFCDDCELGIIYASLLLETNFFPSHLRGRKKLR